MLFHNLPNTGVVAQEITPTVTSEIAATTTPVVLPTLPPPGQLSNPLSGDFLGAEAQTDFGPFSTFFLILGAVALIAGIYFYFVGKNRWRNTHRLNFRLANTWSVIAMALGAAAVAFVLFRLFDVDGLNLRFWLYLIGLVWAVFLGYAIYYFGARYRADLARFARSQRTRQPARTAAAATALPERPKGTPGNPRGTSTRGERRRTRR